MLIQGETAYVRIKCPHCKREDTYSILIGSPQAVECHKSEDGCGGSFLAEVKKQIDYEIKRYKFEEVK